MTVRNGVASGPVEFTLRIIDANTGITVTQLPTAPPLLGSLPEEDRRAIGRALSKVPEQRYPTCAALIEELR